MEVAKLLLDYVRVLIWPLLVVALIVFSRKRLGSLLDRFSGAEIPGLGRIDFQPPLPQDEQPQPPANVPQPEELEKLRKQAADLEKAYRDLAGKYSQLYHLYEYEALWNRLYKSQVEFLQHLSSQPERMVPYLGGFSFYQRGTFWHGPKRESYDHYIGFLAKTGLVQIGSDSSGSTFLQLTPKGVAFLQHMTAGGLTPQMKPGM